VVGSIVCAVTASVPVVAANNNAATKIQPPITPL
jgi:hypothetical protein